MNLFCVVQEISDLWNESALTGKELLEWQTGAIKMAVNLALLNWCVKVWNNALFYNEFYYRRISRLLFYKYLDKRVIEWPEASLILLIPLMYNRSRLRVIFIISNQDHSWHPRREDVRLQERQLWRSRCWGWRQPSVPCPVCQGRGGR